MGIWCGLQDRETKTSALILDQKSTLADRIATWRENSTLPATRSAIFIQYDTSKFRNVHMYLLHINDIRYCF